MNSGSFEQTTTSWLIEKTGRLNKLEVYALCKGLMLIFYRSQVRLRPFSTLMRINVNGIWYCSGPRMMTGMELFEPLTCHMGIDLGGGEVTMAQ